MARRYSFIKDVAFFPWYVGLSMAIAAYLTAKYGAPWYFSGSRLGEPLGTAISKYAWVCTIPFLIGTAASYFKSRVDRKIFDQQKNIDSIRALSWREFERLVGEGFRRRGYFTVETDTGADGGVDLVLRKDGRKYYVQCKHWKARQIGVSIVRELYGVIASRHVDSGFIVTSGSYTSDAKEFAKATNIELIDGNGLIMLLPHIEEADAMLAVQRPSERLCQKCGEKMVLRTAKKGSRAGTQFWGCSAYPKCKFTQDY